MQFFKYLACFAACSFLSGCLSGTPDPGRSAGPVLQPMPQSLSQPPTVAASQEIVLTSRENGLNNAKPGVGRMPFVRKPPVMTVEEEPPVDEEAEEVEPIDAETLADIEVLQGGDQTPPEDAGQSLPHVGPYFDFPVVENDKVRYFVDYFTDRARGTFRLWLERSGRYLPMMQEIFADAGLPRDLAYLAMVESGFNDKAYSWAHAVGPWQFIESTGRRYGLDNDWWRDERRDPEKATRAAAGYLADLYEEFEGDWYLAVASYNAGPGKIRQAIKRYETRDFWELCRGDYLQNETKNYLPKLLAVLLIAKDPEKYGFTDIVYQEPLEYDVAELPGTTDLEVIARLAGADYQLITRLNPELKRWSTPPGDKHYQVRLPAGSLDAFVEGYAALPAKNRANFVRHQVKSGDTLLAMAKRYGVRVEDIQKLNKIRDARALKVGANLIVPLNPDHGGLPVAELSDDYNRSRKVTYKVRNGDSLWKIAQKFDVSEKELRVWNRLGWSNVIRPGQTLVVSAKSAPAKTASKSAAKTVTASSAPLKKVVYKVRPGDTFWAISREFAVEAGEIRRWNNLAENHVLQPGERLTLHVDSSNRG